MLQIVDYSEKAIAVVGDTRDYAGDLKKAGGRFNFRLSCGAGWIFPKSFLPAVNEIISKANGTPVENPLADARVYVGTYHKYNNGSLDGKWLNLADYANKAEFLKACKQLHKDEADPEFMFQDWENIPSWMISESSISDEVWEQKPEPEQAGRQTKAEIRAILEKVLPKGRDIDYYTKITAMIVEIEGRFFHFSKPIIETRFCHPDEPEAEANAWWEKCRTYEFFRSENMGAVERDSEILKDKTHFGTLEGLFIYKENNGLWQFGREADRYYLTKESEATPMDEQTRLALLKATETIAKDFEKRLATWWKRYGADKLHCWTYWADA